MAEIQLEGVQVEFPLYEVKGRSLRHELMRIGGTIAQDARQHVIVQALRDVTLHFRNGDRVGLIGHNGAGKTTLLRVLAGIYEPTRGKIAVDGKAVPLFDITLGMNPDATGHENIRLRGLLLGLSPRQIEERVQDIAEFSDLGDYLYMPIRTYSSGMMVRLAFAVSTSVWPDILLLDEMIGAGDAAFLKRAQERLRNFVSSASIMVLASHSDSVIRDFCNTAVLMNHGRVEMVGPVDEALSRYARIAAQ